MTEPGLSAFLMPFCGFRSNVLACHSKPHLKGGRLSPGWGAVRNAGAERSGAEHPDWGSRP